MARETIVWRGLTFRLVSEPIEGGSQTVWSTRDEDKEDDEDTPGVQLSYFGSTQTWSARAPMGRATAEASAKTDTRALEKLWSRLEAYGRRLDESLQKAQKEVQELQWDREALEATLAQAVIIPLGGGQTD